VRFIGAKSKPHRLKSVLQKTASHCRAAHSSPILPGTTYLLLRPLASLATSHPALSNVFNIEQTQMGETRFNAEIRSMPGKVVH
jgi:hypothetical protein